MKTLFSFVFFVCAIHISIAQNKVQFIFTDNTSGISIPRVSINENGKNIGVGNDSGNVRLIIGTGNHSFEFSSVGYENQQIDLRIMDDTVIHILMKQHDQTLSDVIIVSTMRNNQPIESAPIKIEVLGKEEMNEESAIKPASIASILGDVSGVQVLQSSATSGNVSVHIQGLGGRYTQILRDGIPLYDGFSGNFGILSIPPLDLQQIELVKGSASTLYGGGAIGGLINLISRKPTMKQEATFVANQTSLKETDLNFFLSKRNQHIGYTLFSGYTYQKEMDINKDGFSDLPLVNSFNIHPRLFFYFKNTNITAGYNGTFEKRNGGDMLVLEGKPQGLHQYFEDNLTNRHTAELSVDQVVNNHIKLYFKNNASWFNDDYKSNVLDYNGEQLNYYSELSTLIKYGSNNSFVGGINVIGNRLQMTQANQQIPNHSLQNNTIGFFAQNTWLFKKNTTLELGLRDDIHYTFGNFFLPRIAFFNRFDEHWAMRLGVGFGYKTPDPYAPYFTDYSPDKIEMLPQNIQAEKSIGYNAEVNYKLEFKNGNNIFINQAFFLTQISDPIVGTENPNGFLSYANADKSVVSKGFDTYINAMVDDWELYAGYTFTIVKRNYLNQNQFMPYAPQNRMAFTVVRDFDKIGFHAGLEGSYTGSQKRLDATNTPGYMFIAAMLSEKIGKHFTIILNCENLLNYTQSKVEPLYTGSIEDPQFVPLWAPIDGRVINVSVKYQL